MLWSPRRIRQSSGVLQTRLYCHASALYVHECLCCFVTRPCIEFVTELLTCLSSDSYNISSLRLQVIPTFPEFMTVERIHWMLLTTAPVLWNSSRKSCQAKTLSLVQVGQHACNCIGKGFNAIWRLTNYVSELLRLGMLNKNFQDYSKSYSCLKLAWEIVQQANPRSHLVVLCIDNECVLYV